MVSIVGNTLLELIIAVAQELGPLQPFTAIGTGGGATQVLSPLLDAEAPPEKYGGYYLYNYADAAPNSLLGEQGRVLRDGITTGGVFTVATNFTATPKTGASWLLLGTIPVLDQDGLTGLRTCINRAIRRIWTIYRYPITSTGPTVLSYDLGALFWASKGRFKRLLTPDPGATGHSVPSSGWSVVENADVWTLELGSGFPTGDVFYLECEVPLNYRLYLSGAWANQTHATAGMILGADACLGEWNHVFQCTKYEAMKQLAIQAGGNRKAYWQNEIDKPGGQRDIVSTIKSYQMDTVELTLGEGPTDAPGSWSNVANDKGFWSR